MEKGLVRLTAKKINKRDRAIKIIIRVVAILLLILFLFYVLLEMVYKGGDFTITLDPQFSLKSGLRMYDNIELKDEKIKLYGKGMDFMDNISIKWLPDNLDKLGGGSHNKDNYIAYTFYLENTGRREIDYWYEVSFVDVIKRVDEAVRIMVIRNGKKEVYAKINNLTKKEEEGTKAFYNDKTAILENRKDMKPKEIDTMTFVMWIEGDDPDCLDDIIGGELKTKIRIIESHIEEKK